MVNENASRMAETSHLGRVVNVATFFLVTAMPIKKLQRLSLSIVLASSNIFQFGQILKEHLPWKVFQEILKVHLHYFKILSKLVFY
jgi:hypothetical protein